MKKAFDKVLIVMFENQYRSYVMKDPYMKKLAAAGCNMSNYFGAFHPSQTNYIASLSGEVCSVSNDIPPASPLMQETLVNLMQPGSGPAKVSWKAYMEAFPMAKDKWNSAWENADYPATLQPITEYPNDGINLARYFRKHNAFASFYDIQSVENKWNQIVDEFTFWNDVYQNDLPEYSWFTPDIWNDGHYVYNTHESTNPRTILVGQLSAWLEYVFFADVDTTKVQGGTMFGQGKIGLNLDLDLVLTDPKKAYENSNIPEGTLVVVTWDEADYDANGYDTNYDGQNQVYTVLLGDMITPGTVDDTPYNHYSLIKTIEKNFDLGSLKKNDKDSNWFRFLWNEEFAWSAPKQSNIIAGNALATAYHNKQFGMVYQDEQNELIWTEFNGKQWSAGLSLGIQNSANLALASIGEELMLVFTDDTGALQYAVCKNSEWSKALPLGQSQAGHIALCSYEDFNDSQQKLMLAWQQKEDKGISALIYANGLWAKEAESVGQYTDGPIAASSLGGSVYLVYKERNTFQMKMTSYNTAPFNAFKAHDFKNNLDPANDTSLHQWSPMDFSVGHFSKKMNQHQDEYLANGQLAMSSIEGEMHLAYRKRYDDTPQLSTTVFGLTGIMTARSQETNGFGTLNQAGWTREQIHPNIELDTNSANAMGSSDSQLMQVYQEKGSKNISYRLASYQKK